MLSIQEKESLENCLVPFYSEDEGFSRDNRCSNFQSHTKNALHLPKRAGVEVLGIVCPAMSGGAASWLV